jgi:LmbE family N-acetylglucosaminyl deacetylase
MSAPLLLVALAAVQAPQAGAAAFHQACLDATTDVAVLNVAAHPDDESDRTLVYLRRRFGWRTVTVYSTSGEGGQNAIGREIGPPLARLRVRETLAAAAHTGVDVRWLGFEDFGYSKTVDETMRVWGREALLSRMGAVLDEVDPDLVFTNHTVDGGHGHHRASAVAIRELVAARAAAGEGVRLFERVFARGGESPPGEERKETVRGQLVLDTAALDPVRGLTFARQASDGRHEHRTQGPWSPHDPSRVRPDEWNAVVPDGADPDPQRGLGSLLREPTFVSVWEALGEDLGALQRAFDGFARDRANTEHVAQARALLPALRRAQQALPADAVAAARRLARRIDALERIVLLGSGVEIETWLLRERLPLGGKARIRVAVHGSEPDRIADVRAECRGQRAQPLDAERPRVLEIELSIPASNGPASAVSTFEPDWFEVRVSLAVDGLPLAIVRRLPAEIVPRLTVEWDREVVLVPQRADPSERVLSLRVLYDGDDERTAPVALELPDGVTGESIPAELELSPAHREARALVRLRAAAGAVGRPLPVTARVADASASCRLQPIAATVAPTLSVGLVRGPDDTLQRSLEDLGVPFTELDETKLAVTTLSEFTVIVLDIRAYYHRSDLADHRARLLRFCEEGGRIVAFYHKPFEWNATERRPLLAPFPLKVSNERICEEDSPVEMLQADHPLWHRPHAIDASTFAGWVQERALNVPEEWDERWQPLLSLRDTGEEPLRGALLVARHGQGSYVYCSLALYRQLRLGHVGVARLLVNLLTP